MKHTSSTPARKPSSRPPERASLAWQIAGMAAGLLPWLFEGPGVAPATSLFRLLALPLGGGLVFWGAHALWSGQRRGADRWEIAGLARGWKRPAPWMAVLFFLAVALVCQGMAGQAEDAVVGWFRANAARGQRGLASFWFDGPGWSTPPREHWLGQSTNLLAGAKAPLAARPIYSSRHLALFRLDQPRKLELRLTSDDGSLLMLDGLRVIANLGLHPPREKKAKVKLAAGWHGLEVLHFQERGGAFLELFLPPPIAGALVPIRPGFDARRLWVLNKTAQNWCNRFWFFLSLALALAGLTLLPFPRDWTGAIWRWLKTAWPNLALAGALAGLTAWGLNSMPGVDGDTGHHAIAASDWYWRAHFPAPWAAYANQNFFLWPGYLLQYFFFYSLETLRGYTTACNLAGLVLLGEAIRPQVGRKGSLLFMAVVGSSAIFLLGTRTFIDPFTYAFPGAALVFFGASRARRHWWGAPLCASGLALLWQTHGIFAPLVLGFGLFLLAVGGWRVLLDYRLWLGVVVLASWNHHWLAAFFGAGLGQPATGGAPWSAMWPQARDLLFWQAPGILSGSRLALYAAGSQAWRIPPVTPILLAACLLAWTRVELAPGMKRVLWGLLAMAGLILAVTSKIISGQEIRYAYPLTIVLLLWLAAFLAGAWRGPGKARRLWAGLGLLAVGMGLYAHLAWLIPFSKSGGDLADVPGAEFDSERMVDKRPLYLALAAQTRKVFFPHWDGFSLVFHELEDQTGRRGLQMAPHPTPGVLVVYYRSEQKTVPPNGRAVSLGKDLDKIYLAYVVREERAK